MYEKVNQFHPDKVADRIAGAIVDLAYRKSENPKIAVEVLLGHGLALVIAETSEAIKELEVQDIVTRIAPNVERKNVWSKIVSQDIHLAENQSLEVRCGDNGIFRGCPITEEQLTLAQIAHTIQNQFPSDGKYLINRNAVTICQSKLKKIENNAISQWLKAEHGIDHVVINPLGEWDGGSDVDCGATNRKLGSDMGDGVTGGGLHGKDLSKADVSINIYLHLKAQQTGKVCEAICNIGDTMVDGKPYSEIVKIARDYINSVGGFEKFAEWGLIR